jgi:hypothetical protein
LRSVDPREADHQQHDQAEEQKLDSDRDAYQPPRATRAGSAALAVSRVGHKPRTALVAAWLNLVHELSIAQAVPSSPREEGQGEGLKLARAMELQEEMSAADVVLLMSSVPERINDLVYGLDETRLKYRHGPAFPTLGALISHLVDSGTKVDALLRRAHLAGENTADVRATIDPGHDQDLELPLQEALEDFARVRRRTVDLLHGWGKGEWERTINDPRGTETTLLDVCRLVARHEMSHIAQIRNLTVLLPEPQDLGPVRPLVQ